MSTLDHNLEQELAEWGSRGLRRQVDDRSPRNQLADFVSNDYLGLTQNAEIIEAARAAMEAHGVGGGASRLLGGGTPAHATAEQLAADWLGSATSLLFPSGYQANLGAVTALVGRSDAVFSDQLNHASLVDAARLSRARVHVFRHLDLDQLERQLISARAARRRLVLVEAVYSMDGDLAPLADLHELCGRHHAELLVDEAHSAGILGPDGSGAWRESGAGDEHLAARVVTGGKALGVAGAFVCGSRELRDCMLHQARSFVFSTAATPAVAGALCRAIELCRSATEARQQVRDNARQIASALGLPEPAAAIVPVIVGDPARAVTLSDELRELGIDARAVRPPTVPDGTARLRLVAHATQEPSAITILTGHLAAQVQTPTTTPREESAALFVVGTDTGIGKTVVSALLLRDGIRRGGARYWKPVQTGDDHDTPTVRRLADAPEAAMLKERWCLPLPASPHHAAADAGVAINPDELRDQLTDARQSSQVPLLIELAGGLHVPLHEEYTQADWLAREGLPVVLVARSGLGTLNHTMLTLEALRTRHLEPKALFLVGPPHRRNRETLEATSGVPLVLELPELEPLDPAALDAWLDKNDLTEIWR